MSRTLETMLMLEEGNIVDAYQQGREDERTKVIDFILDKITVRCEDCKFYSCYSDGVRCGCKNIHECNEKIKADWLEQLTHQN